MTQRIFLVAACLLLGSLSGCATLGSKSDGAPEEESELRAFVKSLKGTDASTGLSPEARDIERSLMGG